MSSTEQVRWKDLLRLSKLQVVSELTLSLPWLVASWLFASSGHFVFALACSFMFFLTGLRQTHNAYHYALGVPRGAADGVMFVLSILMLGSMHAVQVNHLRHHRYCMQEKDIEALSARMPWWRALLFGPLFPFLLHHKAVQVGARRQRRWIFAEIAANLAWLAFVFGVVHRPWLIYHVAAMAIGQCLTAFFAVWTVHRGCSPATHIARTMRGTLQSFVTYNMFFHLEHHLYPAVPTCNLKLLARRLDAVAPELARKDVFQFGA